MVTRCISRKYQFLVVAVLFVVLASSAFGQAGKYGSPILPSHLQEEGSGSLAKLRFSPVALSGGAKLSIVAPIKWEQVASDLTSVLKSSHEDFSELLGEIPAFTTTVKLMDEETFYLSTGAPRWTNALFFKNQIILPLSIEKLQQADDLNRSVRHEFTHAMIHALSGGRCPGWLDEGLAQWAEGFENPALKPALLAWISENPPVPFTLLQGGFTKLQNGMVPAAYAQSLFATNTVIKTFGFPKLKLYFEYLRGGHDKSKAFRESFGLSEDQFEGRLKLGLARWARQHD